MSSTGDHIVLFRRAPAELDRSKLECFARTLRGQVAKGADFVCLITGDAELRRLNRDFLGKDYPTDVLSFPAEQNGNANLGDLAISAARAGAQAAALGHTIEDEIRILMLHGLLHLLGMDHETDQGQMQRAEKRWQKRLALPAGVIERQKRQPPATRRQPRGVRP